MRATEVTRNDLILAVNTNTGLAHWLFDHTAGAPQFSMGLITYCSFQSITGPKGRDEVRSYDPLIVEPDCASCLTKASHLA